MWYESQATTSQAKYCFWRLQKPSSTGLVVTISFVTQRKYFRVLWTVLSPAPASTRHVYTGSHFSTISRGNLQGKHIHTYWASWLVSLRETTCLVPRTTGNLVIKLMHPGHFPSLVQSILPCCKHRPRHQYYLTLGEDFRHRAPRSPHRPRWIWYHKTMHFVT